MPSAQQSSAAAPAAVSAHSRPSHRSEEIKPFEVMEVARAAVEQEARTCKKVLHLEIGQPSAGPPPAVTEAAIAALRLPPSEQGYTSTPGLPSLRSGIASLYSKRHGLEVSPDDIVVTTGSSGGFVALFASAFDAGDRVALAEPGYPCYRNVLRAFSVEVVPVHVNAADGYQPTVSQLAAQDAVAPLRGVIVASPANPTGAVLSAARLSELASFCASRGALLVADEIYHGLTRSPAPTAVRYDNAVVVNSFSKFWCMPGFRVGWLVVHGAELRAAIVRALQSMAICAPAAAQHAALAALGSDCAGELEGHVVRYLAAADRLIDVLIAAGFEEVRRPDGAFYVYVRCDKVCRRLGVEDSSALCRLVLERVAVAVTPGVDFDPVRGGDYVRFSCAGSSEDIAEAGRRVLRLVTEPAGGSANEL